MEKKPRYRYGNLNPGTARFRVTGAFYFLFAWLAAGVAIPVYMFRPSEHDTLKECDNDYMAARKKLNERIFGTTPKQVYFDVLGSRRSENEEKKQNEQ